MLSTVAITIFTSTIVAGCHSPSPTTPVTQTAAAVQPLRITHPHDVKPVVGSEIDTVAEGLPPGRRVDLFWQTVSGGWVIEDYFHFRGKKFKETSQPLGQAETDDDGRLAAHFRIPEDYGGVHELIVRDNGTTVAQGGVEVAQTF
ncbi:MAG TPA: hypothetical protein VLV86_13905, partial [Vicinamibacterales bacterium]|nr:hypothetical protein [Vicinamibacterales bacterium]